jgi:hypothetical protein
LGPVERYFIHKIAKFRDIKEEPLTRAEVETLAQMLIIGSWGNWVETHKPVANDGSNPRNSKYWS